MREAPIGVFDSGVGGLSVLGEIQRLLPNESLLYLSTDGQAMAFLLLGCAAALAFPLGPDFVATRLGRSVQRFGVWAIAPVVSR